MPCKGVEIVEYPMLRVKMLTALMNSTYWLPHARGLSNTHVLTSTDPHVIHELFLIPN